MTTNFYSEEQTDRYIRETFFPDYSYKGIMVEVGAGPEEGFSASKHWRESGWRCICIEPNPKFVEQHRAKGNEIYQYACSNKPQEKATFQTVATGTWPEDMDHISYSALEVRYPLTMGWPVTTQIEVEVITLNSLLEKLGVERIDYVSIDVEGWEIEVMEGFDTSKYKPKVILIENYEHKTEYVKYMKSIGYPFHGRLDYNYIFTREEQ
jgi:FkbM family methyltransferase